MLTYFVLPGRSRLAVARVIGFALVLATASGLLASCAYRGGIDEPVVRKATWFSYLDGSDIRETCAPGQFDRVRVVYNARYMHQVRSYELTDDGVGGAILVARALGPADFTRLSLEDLQAPWRWDRSEIRLSPAEFQAFRTAMADSGALGPSPVGLRLYSEGFYWVASGCVSGQPFFNAWSYPSDRFDALRFPAFLFAHDGTGVPVSPPRPTYGRERLQEPGRQEDWKEIRFTLQVGRNGLGGISEL